MIDLAIQDHLDLFFHHITIAVEKPIHLTPVRQNSNAITINLFLVGRDQSIWFIHSDPTSWPIVHKWLRIQLQFPFRKNFSSRSLKSPPPLQLVKKTYPLCCWRLIR